MSVQMKRVSFTAVGMALPATSVQVFSTELISGNLCLKMSHATHYSLSCTAKIK
jgi:hypothetical protein